MNATQPKPGTSRRVNSQYELYYREFGWLNVSVIEKALMNLDLDTRIACTQHLNDLQDAEVGVELNHSLPSALVGEILRLKLTPHD